MSTFRVVSPSVAVPPGQRIEQIPAGTILAPNGTRMPYALAVTAYRRLLGCPRVTPATLDAVQLFRGRFVGGGPEAR